LIWLAQPERIAFNVHLAQITSFWPAFLQAGSEKSRSLVEQADRASLRSDVAQAAA
jgi:hypothetical protein